MCHPVTLQDIETEASNLAEQSQLISNFKTSFTLHDTVKFLTNKCPIPILWALIPIPIVWVP